MLRIAICDDNEVILEKLKEIVKELCREYSLSNQIDIFTGGSGLLEEHDKERYDIVFLDIFMPQIDGFEVAHPNGAGKSTTIKMMSGIMTPTSGNITIGGLSPQTHRKQVVQKLGVVFGQRSQLNWDLRLGESFELLRRIYRVPEEEYRRNLEELVEVLGLTGFIDIPVRQLSLGQRMRGELAAAMLHSPDILFLDEPTIGLDIDAKKAVREFILEINKRRGVTVILTSHDLEDVSKLCNRLIVINDGVIVRDGPIDEIVRDMAPYRIMKLIVSEKKDTIKCDKVELVSSKDNNIVCRFDHHKYTASEIIGELSKELSIIDLTVEEPDIEEAVARIYHAE